MRQCLASPARQLAASSRAGTCSYVRSTTPSWAPSMAAAQPLRHASTATGSSAAGGSTPATSTKVAAATSPAAVAAAPVESTAYSPYPAPPSTAAAHPSEAVAPAPASAEALADVTTRLRAALRALSEVEQAKAADAQRKKKGGTAQNASPGATVPRGASAAPSATAASPAAATPSTTASSSLSAAGAQASGVSAAPSADTPSRGSGEKAEAPVSSATGVRPSASPSSSSSSSTAALPPTSASQPSSLAATAAWSTVSWIRNKKPKFWAIVNEAGTEDAADAATEGVRAAQGQAPRTPSPTPANAAGDTPEATAAAAAAPSSTARHTTSGQLQTSMSPSPAAGGRVEPLAASATSAAALVEKAAPTRTAASASPTSRAPSAAAASGAGLTFTSPLVTAHSMRVPTSMPPFRSRYKRDVAHVLSELLSSDPALGSQLLGQLSAESRRLLLIMGTASEYFGADYDEVAEQVKEADTDRDNSISSTEYDNWVRRMADSSSTKRRYNPETGGAQQAGAAAAVPPTSTSATGASGSPAASPAPETSAVTRSNAFAHPPVALSATLSRQRAEMAIDTANAAKARIIIGAMQRNVEPAAAGAAGARVAAPSHATGTTTKCATSAVTAANSGILQSPAPAPTSGTSAAAQAVATGAAGSGGAGAVSALSTSPGSVAAGSQPPSGFIPWSAYARVVVAAVPPFLAFGMLDNTTLVLAGGAIDNALSGSLGLSQMAAASMGGVVSGVAGIQVHGLAERYTRAAPPQLTAEQQGSESYSRATQLGNTLGMVLGLVLGMTPLLFMSGSSQQQQQAEQEERDRHHLRQEAVRSHERRCKAAMKEEATRRLQVMKEEDALRAALMRQLRQSPA